MNKAELIGYLEGLDASLKGQATLTIYGSAACILLDEPDRTSLDMDVAGPYSSVDESDLRQAAESVGLPVNPSDDYSGNHIEWIGPLRLCLQAPKAGEDITLWQGERLRIQTGSIAGLIASKLVRYDEIDQGDIRYLLSQGRVPYQEIEEAVSRLPSTFCNDPLVQENLVNLKADMQMWGTC
ncbi:MAG: hypothetical protein O2901_16350 [Verrucomicrobia bacterium]|nr:hypothetical protein [Verrucomicrobiota bacterium]